MRDSDSKDPLSGIRATADERPYGAGRDMDYVDAGVRAPLRPQPAGQTSGLLWAVCGALVLALIGLGYWTHQQQTHLQRQMVATQNSFARISEEAAGQLQDISGKVTATESSLSEVEQARQAIEGLEQRLEELAELVTGQARTLLRVEQGGDAMQAFGSEQQARLERLGQEAAALSGRIEAFETHAADTAGQLAALQAQVEALEGQTAAIGDIEERLADQMQRIEAQQKALTDVSSKVSDDTTRQALATLRTELTQRLATAEQELRAIDGFRLQTNRSITTLQSQIRTLQQGAQP